MPAGRIFPIAPDSIARITISMSTARPSSKAGKVASRAA
jgi:hypothetical protein